MPPIELQYYMESDGSVPLLEWLDKQPKKVIDKCRAYMELLEEKGHELRRPHCDYLTEGIYELRIRHLNRHYRILYFFHGQSVVVAAHGLIKEKDVPKTEIKKAIERRNKFLQSPDEHSYQAE